MYMPRDFRDESLGGLHRRNQGTRKLNQNRSALDIAGVSKGQAAGQNQTDPQIARLMSQGENRV